MNYNTPGRCFITSLPRLLTAKRMKRNSPTRCPICWPRLTHRSRIPICLRICNENKWQARRWKETVALQLRSIQWSTPFNDFPPVMDFGNELRHDCLWHICSQSSHPPQLFVQQFTNKLYPRIRSEGWQRGGEEEGGEANLMGGDTRVQEKNHRQQVNGNKLSGAVLKWDQ